jgi:uncharacterized repeat protein (TIGR01451 family)
MDKEKKQNLPAVELVQPAENFIERIEDVLVDGKMDGKKDGNIFIGTLNIVADPIAQHFKDRHEKFYRVNKLHLAADIFFALLILALAGIFIYLFNFHPKAQIALSTSVEPVSIQSGQNETFTIAYKNNGKIDIKSATLSLIFPKNFTFIAASPDNIWSDQTNTFTIGDLPRGASGLVKIIGAPAGAIGSQQTLNYSLNYQENGQMANTLGSYIFPLESSVLSISFDAPKQIYQNLDFSGTINLKNSGTADITGEIDTAFAYNSVVIKSISSDQANLVNGIIIVNGLKAGKNLAIEYEGATHSGEGLLTVALESDLNSDGHLMKQATVESKLNVTVPKFGAEISANKDYIKGEEAVNYKLIFTNKENIEINDATLTIAPADSAVLIKDLTATTSAEKYKLSGNTFELGNLSPGQSGELNFSVLFSRRLISANQQTGIIANVNYQLDGHAVEYQMFSPKIKILSDLQIGSKGLYYSAQGDQLGIGPLPPVVDVPTHYWIFWEINNSGNELKNVTVSADLPANVGWSNQKTVLAGDLRYGQISHKVIWTVDDVAAAKGNYRAGFEVELIPAAADLGKIPALISNVQYSADDSFAGQGISGSLPNINADLKDDPTASGKGTVIQLKIVK